MRKNIQKNRLEWIVFKNQNIYTNIEKFQLISFQIEKQESIWLMYDMKNK